MTTCAICGKDYEDVTAIYDGRMVCDDCLTNFAECTNCGDFVELTHTRENRDGEVFCEECFYDFYFTCPNCNEITEMDDGINVAGVRMCEECFSEQYAFCENCSNTVSINRATFIEDEGYYCPSCMLRHGLSLGVNSAAGRTHNCPSLKIEKTTYKINRFKRKFGVEIEAEQGDVLKLIDLVSLTRWNLTEDGSLDSTGVEAVSPVLQGDYGYKSIEMVCEAMTKAGFKATPAAGVHVHFDFTEEPEEEIKKIVAAYYQYDDFWFRMLPASRRNNYYCKKLDRYYENLPEQIFGRLDDIYCDKDEKERKYCSLRYTTLNIHSYYYRGTLEVRSHSATLSAQKIINWIDMHQKFFNWAKSKPLRFWLNHKPSLKEWKEIMGIRLFAYYNDRVREFQNHKARASNKDLKTIIKEKKRMKSVLSRVGFNEVNYLYNGRTGLFGFLERQ